MKTNDSEDRLGWWAISGVTLLESLNRVAAGEDPNFVYGELYTDSDHEFVPGAEKKAQPVHDQPDLNPNNLPLLEANIPVAALDGIRAVAKRWLTKRFEEGIAGSSYATALEHCADELDAAIDMAEAQVPQ